MPAARKPSYDLVIVASARLIRTLWFATLLFATLLFATTTCGRESETPSPALSTPASPAAGPASASPNVANAANATATTEAASTARPSAAPPLLARGRRGLLAFSLHLSENPPPVGGLFQVVTTVRDNRSGEPVTDLDQFSLDATMPAHGHGMVTDPEHRPLGGGSWLSRGMKLHMHGEWVFHVSASRRQTATRPAIEDSALLRFDQPVEGAR